MNDDQREQLTLQIEQYLDGTLTESQFDAFEKTLTNQPEARELYLDLMQQNAHLQLDRTHLSNIRRPSVAQTLSPERSRSRTVVLTCAFAALAMSLLFAVWSNFPENDTVSTPVFATISDSSDAVWGDCTLPTATGSSLSEGRLEIVRGLATIRFHSGAEVTLESPAKLEIESALRGRLMTGTAVVEVPESAHGFTLATPTAIAIDHGTAFAVTIDRISEVSTIEVLDGDVEVRHIGSNATCQLTSKERVVASPNGLSDSAASTAEAQLAAGDSHPNSANVHRITTADGRGRDATICQGETEDVRENSRAELVLVKNPFHGFERFGRKGYFAFDLESLKGQAVQDVRFILTLQPSWLGFASKVEDCEFIVYGVQDESTDNWQPERLSWETAPANQPGPSSVDSTAALELGRFVVKRGHQHGQVLIEGDALADFLNSDTNEIVTFIVVRATKESDSGGLVHGFANRLNTTSTPPTLIVTTAPQE